MNTAGSIYSTSPSRVVLAFVFGALVGTAITTTQYLINLYEVNGAAHFAEWAVSKGWRVSLLFYPFWLLFIIAFGAPVWLLMHRLNFRGWAIALGCGAAVSAIVTFAMATGMFTGRAGGNYSYYGAGGQQWESGVLTAFGWKTAAINSAEFSLIGAVIALFIWAVAYRKS